MDSFDSDLLQIVLQILEEMGIPYLVGGGVALTVWATPRMTHDIDIVVDMPGERITEFCSHFPSDRYFIDAEDMDRAFRHKDTPSLGMYSFTDMETGYNKGVKPLPFRVCG